MTLAASEKVSSPTFDLSAIGINAVRVKVLDDTILTTTMKTQMTMPKVGELPN